MKFLIAEDAQINYLLLQKFLMNYGNCEIAVNGEDAFNAFLRAHKKKAPFDLIFLDILMPKMDGNETLKKIRAWEKSHLSANKEVPIIMVTALDYHDTVAVSFQEGAQRYLVKPFEAEDIDHVLDELGFKKTK